MPACLPACLHTLACLHKHPSPPPPPAPPAPNLPFCLQVQVQEELIPRLTGRPGEQAKLRRAKQVLKQRMAPEVGRLVRWLAGGYAGFDLLPTRLQAHAASVGDAHVWSTGTWARGGAHVPGDWCSLRGEGEWSGQ